ncbi:L,D-transpeptidase family protein [Streptomyces sp. AK04-4c]|uniref:L,D-transpeptidase family protein n=1 Tax=Streptomyces sp. AK04-4c TaxID=3028651 RepID=UPI0029B1E118|nr:L,D-transpeptidase family protein [Streptomyces sp. AK04-4c]MDX3682551.1 L,D-transpeptidase family protein [Streptomyces sp. AK04-4c]
MGRTRTGRHARRVRTAAAAAVGALALAMLTAGCRIEDAGAAGSTAPPAVATARPAASASADDGKPGGGTPSPSATSSRTPSASPSPAPRTLMSVGDRSGRVRELQARLRQIGHFDRSPTGYYGTATVASVQSFQGKRGLSRTGRTDTVTWERLLAMTRKPTAKELDPPAPAPAVAKPDARCLTGRVLCISKNTRTLSWMIDGRVVSSMDVRFGSQYTPTREGTFSVYWKSRHHVSTLYDSPMPYAMFFSGGQAVHYSSDFAARGYSGASHGCVNVRDEGKIASLFDQVRNGDKVVIYW